MKIRLTPLDPRRPARDMLDDLLSGIRGCWLLYHEYADLRANEHDAELSDEDGDEAFDDDLDDAVDTAFRDAVRAQASAHRHRIDLEPRPATVGTDALPVDFPPAPLVKHYFTVWTRDGTLSRERVFQLVTPLGQLGQPQLQVPDALPAVSSSRVPFLKAIR